MLGHRTLFFIFFNFGPETLRIQNPAQKSIWGETEVHPKNGVFRDKPNFSVENMYKELRLPWLFSDYSHIEIRIRYPSNRVNLSDPKKQV